MKGFMPQTKYDTKVELVKILEEKLKDESLDDKQKGMIMAIQMNAQRGFYHDFESPVAFPKMRLVDDLNSAGLWGLADDVKEGLFDE